MIKVAKQFVKEVKVKTEDLIEQYFNIKSIMASEAPYDIEGWDLSEDY